MGLKGGRETTPSRAIILEVSSRLLVAEQQAERSDALLSKSEEQAERMDAVLDRWDRILRILEERAGD